tara:strand:+ start:19109 stop:19771 length:663 start_codon:yes stop_codon:yes gene_type:complete
MESLRKFHNTIKKDLILKYSKGARVLDVGCGRGGDLHKWKLARADVTMIDPDIASIREANERQYVIGTKFNISVGDIFTAPRDRYDVVCYNFALQYIFKSTRYFHASMTEIVKRVSVGGKFIGCIPDSEFILMNPQFKDTFGNFFKRKRFGQVGDTVDVMLANTPYYGGKVIPEPIAYKDILITWLENNGFILVEWEPICSEQTHTISDLYSKFCFVKVR